MKPTANVSYNTTIHVAQKHAYNRIVKGSFLGAIMAMLDEMEESLELRTIGGELRRGIGYGLSAIY